MIDDVFYEAEDVARLLKTHVRSVYRMIEREGLPAINIGTGARKRYRIRKSDLEAWLEARTRRKKEEGGLGNEHS